jgi:hypothetical protein
MELKVNQIEFLSNRQKQVSQENKVEALKSDTLDYNRELYYSTTNLVSELEKLWHFNTKL